MNPKAASLPNMSVRTGAANFKNDLEDTFVSVVGGLDAKSFLRQDGMRARVPAHCARSVAMAAPLRPMPSLQTQRRSPTTFTTVEYAMAMRGVRESLAPSSAACRTP
mmetsp:Transcript_18183/g.26969  ORF Transcript_18183/g.26969 Transcript_18183/m.26969 type:complete len:107 (-) Transcript_18183:76-396(-)